MIGQADVTTRLLGIAFLLAMFALLIGVPVAAIQVKRRGVKRLDALIAESIDHGSPSDPLVSFKFHTYHGVIIAFVEQTTHTILRPAGQAKWLLRRLHRFNLTWGLFALGSPIIQILSYFEYRSQMLSIDEQCEAATTANSPSRP